MIRFLLIPFWLPFLLCSEKNETVYVGSTTAPVVVRNFFGIPLSDSVDFIRWKLVMQEGRYQLSVQYGIGKPGTAGFIDEKRLSLSGQVEKTGSNLQLIRGDKKLYL